MTAKPMGNKGLRTRKDLLLAAGKLLREGRTPTMDEVAQEALVSRATAYRYFSDIKDLLLEVPVDSAVKDPAELFEQTGERDVAERLDMAEAVMHESVYKNEVQLRLMLAKSLTRALGTGGSAPVRQNRRSAYIKEAMAPARGALDAKVCRKLSAALTLIFGAESMIVFRDVLPLEPAEARAVKSWAIRALVRAAQEESRAGAKRRRRR